MYGDTQVFSKIGALETPTLDDQYARINARGVLDALLKTKDKIRNFNVLAGPYPEVLKITPPQAATVLASGTMAPFRGVIPALGGAAGGVGSLKLLNWLKPSAKFRYYVPTAGAGILAGSLLAEKYFGKG